MPMGIQLHSDLRLSFEQIGIKFQSILTEYQEQFETLSRRALESFDFEKAFAEHIHGCIEDGLEKAFSEIDLSERFKIEIWHEVEKRLNYSK
jgi:hypothetical protein